MTRPRTQAGPLSKRLASLGAEVVPAPLIKTVPPASWAALEACLERLGSYDAAVFASAGAVDAFFGHARRRLVVPALAPAKVYAVGPATARALAAHGWRSQPLPEAFNGAALARRLGRVKGKRILIPRSAIGREDLPRLLKKGGALLDLPVVYSTLPDAPGTPP